MSDEAFRNAGYLDGRDPVERRIAALEAELAECKAEVERLKDVVAQVDSLASGIIKRNQGGYVGDWNDTKTIRTLARAALAEPSNEQEGA